MKKGLLFLILCVCVAFFQALPIRYDVSYAEKTETGLNLTSKAALLYDANSGTVVYEKNANAKLPIASMTKVASLMLIFEAIGNGKLKEDDLVRVSKWAADTEGSSAFLDENEYYKVEDLIMTIIVCSANDSTVVLAEAVAGSEDLFVKQLNRMVNELGLKNTNFTNSTGLPALDHYSSAHDISKIYLKICDNPLYKKYSKIWMTKLKHPSGRETDIVNTNRLIKTYSGCDSGKTGFTNDAGFCLTASATRGEMRLIGTIIGSENSKTRFNEMASMFDFGFNNYENRMIINKENPILSANVKNSKIKEVYVYPKNNFVKFLENGKDFKYSIDYKISNVKAPLNAGDKVGILFVLDSNNMVVFEDELIVHESVKEEKLKDLIIKILKEL